jgi:hypothetical protein
VSWSVAQRASPDAPFSAPVAAERTSVEDLLASIDKSELLGFEPGGLRKLSGERAALYAGTGDALEGGVFGAACTDADGGAAVEFQRRGEDVVAWAPPELLELAATPLAAFASLRLRDTVEVEQVRLRLSSARGERVFERDARGRWTEAGRTEEARELHAVLDPLCFLRAARHVDAEQRRPLEDPVEVEFKSRAGAVTRFTVGRVAGAASGAPGTDEVELDGARAVLAAQGLHARLWALAGPR